MSAKKKHSLKIDKESLRYWAKCPYGSLAGRYGPPAARVLSRCARGPQCTDMACEYVNYGGMVSAVVWMHIAIEPNIVTRLWQGTTKALDGNGWSN